MVTVIARSPHVTWSQRGLCSQLQEGDEELAGEGT